MPAWMVRTHNSTYTVRADGDGPATVEGPYSGEWFSASTVPIPGARLVIALCEGRAVRTSPIVEVVRLSTPTPEPTLELPVLGSSAPPLEAPAA